MERHVSDRVVALRFAFVNNFRIIGEGDAPNFMVHQLVHVTVNANADVTAEVNNTDVTCR